MNSNLKKKRNKEKKGGDNAKGLEVTMLMSCFPGEACTICFKNKNQSDNLVFDFESEAVLVQDKYQTLFMQPMK